MLPHLGADDVDRDDAVAVDAVPNGRLEGAWSEAPRHRPRIVALEAEHERGARHADQETAPRRQVSQLQSSACVSKLPPRRA